MEFWGAQTASSDTTEHGPGCAAKAGTRREVQGPQEPRLGLPGVLLSPEPHPLRVPMMVGREGSWQC